MTELAGNTASASSPSLRTGRAPDGPDFLCVGLQKAATGWLYDQLQFHPEFWMPPVKELHYFDTAFPNKRFKEALAKDPSNLERANARRAARGLRPLDGRDRDFFEVARSCIGKPADVDRYANLFRPKGDLLTGDVTPAYCSLSEAVIDSIVTRFPDIKVVMLLRDPVQRVMSQIAMVHRKELITGVQKAPELAFERLGPFKEFFFKYGFANRSFGTQYVTRWSNRVPQGQFSFFFFDDIVSQPETVRRDIVTFLGADPDKKGRHEAGFNRKASQNKLVLPDEIQGFLKEYFRSELEQSAIMFGGYGQRWLSRHFPSADAKDRA